MDRHLLTLVPTIPSPRGTYNTQALFVVDKRPSHPLAEEKGGDGDDEDGDVDGTRGRDLAAATGAPTLRSAWTDTDDATQAVHLKGQARLRKLRAVEDEDEVSGAVYEGKLRARFNATGSNQRWAEALAAPAPAATASASADEQDGTTGVRVRGLSVRRDAPCSKHVGLGASWGGGGAV